MTPDERKGWEATVRNFGTKGTVLYQSPWAESILAADAELTALRARVAVLEKVVEAAEAEQSISYRLLDALDAAKEGK